MNNLNTVEVWMNGVKVGRVALTPESLCAFEYDSVFIKTGNSISPFYLPLRQEVFIAKRNPFKGGFGVFNDSLPDGWGSLILDRYIKNKGIDPARLTLIQRLALVGSNGRGALEYRSDWSEISTSDILSFDQIAVETEKILSSQVYVDSLETLYKKGGSPGGARPKVFAKVDDKEWLVKFKATNDADDIGVVEYEYSFLAKKCGINMPETRLFEGKYFGVQRFDRSDSGKTHTVSAAGLLNANYREPCLDYETLLKLCLQLTKNMEEVYALFRLMVFNVAIKNRDDHANNFSFQFSDNEWKLSPAYDLLPSQGFNGFHTTTINNNGEPTQNDILIVAEKISLNKQRVINIVEEITGIVQKSI